MTLYLIIYKTGIAWIMEFVTTNMETYYRRFTALVHRQPQNERCRGAEVHDDDSHLEEGLDDSIINHVQYINISIFTQNNSKLFRQSQETLHGLHTHITRPHTDITRLPYRHYTASIQTLHGLHTHITRPPCRHYTASVQTLHGLRTHITRPPYAHSSLK
jgi:hypothetical protein